MCGIAAYVGKRKSKEFVIEGLSRLEYRGYDSAGFVCCDSQCGRLQVIKAAGKLSVLKEKLQDFANDGCCGMGHTRWATHGIANRENAHPHVDCKRKIALVHNGIIEDYQIVREKLIASGHVFTSETDTETIVHLFEAFL